MGQELVIEFTCPHCENKLKVERQHIGQSGLCGKCGKQIRIALPKPSITNQPTHPVSTSHELGAWRGDRNSLTELGATSNAPASASEFTADHEVRRLAQDAVPRRNIISVLSAWLKSPPRVQSLLAKAELGFAYAQVELGAMYRMGATSHGVEQDYVKALYWYTKAAKQGNAPAQSDLGLMYEEGLGVVQDYHEATEWYTKAAERGYSPAQFSLGKLYANGKGVPQDDTKAVVWFERWASTSDRQTKLGEMYRWGYYVPKDVAKAVEWLEKVENAKNANKTAESEALLVRLRLASASLAGLGVVSAIYFAFLSPNSVSATDAEHKLYKLGVSSLPNGFEVINLDMMNANLRGTIVSGVVALLGMGGLIILSFPDAIKAFKSK